MREEEREQVKSNQKNRKALRGWTFMCALQMLKPWVILRREGGETVFRWCYCTVHISYLFILQKTTLSINKRIC